MASPNIIIFLSFFSLRTKKRFSKKFLGTAGNSVVILQISLFYVESLNRNWREYIFIAFEVKELVFRESLETIKSVHQKQQSLPANCLNNWNNFSVLLTLSMVDFTYLVI